MESENQMCSILLTIDLVNLFNNSILLAINLLFYLFNLQQKIMRHAKKQGNITHRQKSS